MPIQLLQSSQGLLQASSMIGSPTWRWLRQWKRHQKQATKHGHHAPAAALHRLSTYSQSLRWQDNDDAETAAERKRGALVVLRTAKEVDFWQQQSPLMIELEIAHHLVEASLAQALEPGLGQEITWTHAMHFPQAESINPRLWTQHLRLQAQEMGISIRTGIPIQSISSQPLGIQALGMHHPHDAVIICTGSSHNLLRQSPLPIMPVWGYSVTAPVRDAQQAPRASIMDWQQQATISRMGQRVRITAGLEMGSTAEAPHHAQTLQRMYRLLNDWFPGGIQLSSPQVQVWRGARGHLPDGLPAVGSSGTPGIWLNMAHGSHGNSVAAGCARAMADMVAGRKTAIDMQAFDPLRF